MWKRQGIKYVRIKKKKLEDYYSTVLLFEWHYNMFLRKRAFGTSHEAFFFLNTKKN